MTPRQEMELLLEEAGRQNGRQEMELLLKEADRQSMGDTCPTCGQGKDHAGWMLCLDTRLERKENMTDAENFGKNKDKDAQVPTPENHGLPGDVVRPTGAETGRAKEPASGRKVRQAKNGPAASVPSSRRNAPMSKSGMSKSAQSLLRRPMHVELMVLFISFGLGALTSIGLGLRSVFQFFVGAVLRSVRGVLALPGLLAQGVVEVGRGILRLLSLVVRGVVAAVNGILGLLSMLVRGVVSAGQGVLRLSQLLVGAVAQAGKQILAMFKLLVQGLTTAGKQVVRLLMWIVKPVSWAMGMLVRGSIRVGRRVHELLELSAEAAGRLIPTRQVAPEAIGLITSEGGPQVTDHVSAEATILITSGLDQGRSFQVGGQPVTIGSGENCGIRLPAAPGFAAEHARLWWRDGQRMLHHLAPDESTVVAGKQIIWTSLQDGDEASIGPYSLRITTASAGVSS